MLGAVSVPATAAGVVERNVHSSAVEIPEPDDGRLIFADNERMPLLERESNLNVKGHKLGERALAVVDFRSSRAYALDDSGLAYSGDILVIRPPTEIRGWNVVGIRWDHRHRNGDSGTDCKLDQAVALHGNVGQGNLSAYVDLSLERHVSRFAKNGRRTLLYGFDQA